MPAGHLTLGAKGEEAAARYLKKHGYKIVDRNWRGRRGELDIVCSHKGGLVFVEVKTRTPGPMNAPHQGLTPAKMQRMARTVGEYLSRHEAWDKPCRLDLVAVVVPQDGRPEIEHVENAVVLGGGDGWQPW